MSLNGSYKIIDLKDYDFQSGTAQTVPGIYEEIENNYRKPTLLSGIIVEGVDKPDGYVIFSVKNGDGNYAGSYGDFDILIKADDTVTITKTESEESV